ncbi:protein RICE SALT SENSITIVE 3-like [Impatiens glandulifera]|uniref:protein RICE SALT SENSITIVE 3-like n=1 Tax=Impatiens glandulifera TaxID=253017 RepID=UPI001FB113BB|nr:protein RICE SALT SENSITIVE 3-like [Impatiens glandulifera]
MEGGGDGGAGAVSGGGLPLLNCIVQEMLRSLCSSSNWVYAVFWKVLPRNYPPPKWDYGGGGVLDRSKGNRRNWILVWEDGYCDLYECHQRSVNGYLNEEGTRRRSFGADVFFKLSHEVYSYGEGLVGKVAADNSHKWVFRDTPKDNNTLMTSWNVSIDPQPRAWDSQFNSGIQTIAVISVKEGIVQLGSFHKIDEDLNMVISIQRKFSYLQSIPGGIFAIQRPYDLPIYKATSNYNLQNSLSQILSVASSSHGGGACFTDNRKRRRRGLGDEIQMGNHVKIESNCVLLETVEDKHNYNN